MKRFSATSRVRLRHQLLAGAFAATALSLSGAPLACALSAEAGVTEPATVLAQGTKQAMDPSQITDKVTDEAGVLSASEKSQIEQKIKQLQQERQVIFYVVMLDELPGMSAEEFTSDVVDSRGPNTGVMLVTVEDRKYGIQTGDQWPRGLREEMDSAAQSELASEARGGAALAALDVALNGGGSGSSGGSGSEDGGLWVAGGLGAVAVTGGGLWLASKRGRKKQQAATLESAREIAPGDVNRLNRLDTETLEKLASEELVSTDESIRRGKEELDLATAEFGPERTRPFTKAMNHSTTTLQRAFRIQQQLNDAVPETEPQRRHMLLDIIASCGTADEALDKEAEKFAEMRNLLINADSKIAELTQQTVDLRTRLPQVEAKAQQLGSQYPEKTLATIADNPEMAVVALDEAEKHLATARELEAKPAGEQGGLVAAIRNAEEAAQLADKLMRGVEHAEANIAEAKAGLGDIIAEIEEEIREARTLENQGAKQGTQADWEALRAVITKAQEALRTAQASANEDPLGQYNALVDMDAEVDEHLDPVRETTREHGRILALLAQQMNSAASQIQAAEDLISSRRRIIGSGARTALADAQRYHAQALQLRESQPQGALDAARNASAAAATALQRAQDDIDSYRRRQQSQQFSNSAGNILTGMVIGQMLGGNSGGFGGGFGGGGFGGGGGFSGGGGGGFSGGSY